MCQGIAAIMGVASKWFLRSPSPETHLEMFCVNAGWTQTNRLSHARLGYFEGNMAHHDPL